MRDTRNTSITHRDLAHDRCEKSSRGIWQRVDTATRYRACRCGTLRAEWQCNSRQPVRSGSSGSAGRDGPKLVSATSASGCALSEAGPKPYRERPLREGGISLQLGGCNWVAFLQATTGWPFCRLDGPLFCRLDGPLAGQADLLHMSIAQEPYRAQCWYSPCATQANRNARRSLMPVRCQLVQVVEVGVCHGRIGCGLLINDAR